MAELPRITTAPAGRPQRLAVIGAGTMGRGIAMVAVQAGLETVLIDIDRATLDSAREGIEGRLARGIDEAEAARQRGLLSVNTDFEVAVVGRDVVIEAVPEIDDLKVDIFRRLATSTTEDALLVSNTSTMSISKLADACAESTRVIGMHFFNPVHRMALVEIVVGSATSERTVDDAVRLAVALGKDPVVVKDVPGFVTSRLGLLLGNEAMRIVEEGVASAADVDKALRLGYGHPMGPLELADLVGLDARLNNATSMYRRSGDERYRAPEILQRLVTEGRLGRKTASGFYDYDEQGRRVDPKDTRR